jgi:hypothetical protein
MVCVTGVEDLDGNIAFERDLPGLVDAPYGALPDHRSENVLAVEDTPAKPLLLLLHDG